MVFSIYRITNLMNGKCYIGKTVKNPAIHRYYEHKHAANTGGDTVLYRALRKYGFDNFKFEVIYVGDDGEDANEFEKRFIVENNSHIHNNGYNMTIGGDGVDPEIISKHNLERVANGTHPFLGSGIQQRRLDAGTHNLQGESGSALQRKRVAEGTHPMAGERGAAKNKERVLKGTNAFAGDKGSELATRVNKERLAAGTHPSQTIRTCPHCDHQGKGGSMIRWHFDNCKNKVEKNDGT